MININLGPPTPSLWDRFNNSRAARMIAAAPDVAIGWPGQWAQSGGGWGARSNQAGLAMAGGWHSNNIISPTNHGGYMEWGNKLLQRKTLTAPWQVVEDTSRLKTWNSRKGVAEAYKGSSGIGAMGKTAMSAFGGAFSAYFAYSGWQGEVSDRSGFMGMMDAVSIDFGAHLGIAHNTRGKMTSLVRSSAEGGWEKASGRAKAQGHAFAGAGLGGMMRVGLGSFAGAQLGHSVLGMPGAVAGGMAGGFLFKTNIRAAAATAVIGGAYVIGKGTYEYVKAGYRRGREMRLNGPDTAGDTAAFFTQNAFTMRQRSVQAMRRSHLNARSALGQEAQFMHMNKSYFSNYR